MKYIDAEKLKAEIDKLHDAPVPKHDQQCDFSDGYSWGLNDIENLIDSLQQDDTQVDKMLCSQTLWEEQGWIMIPPDATIKGIDSLLKQVRKKLQQEQQEVDLEEEIATWIPSHITGGEEGVWKECREAVTKWAGIVARHFYELGLSARKED